MKSWLVMRNWGEMEILDAYTSHGVAIARLEDEVKQHNKNAPDAKFKEVEPNVWVNDYHDTLYLKELTVQETYYPKE
jgi:hypothetical protein